MMLILLYVNRRWQNSAWARVCDPALLPYVLVQRPSGSRARWPILALACATSLCILALAGPTWERLPQPLFRQPSVLVIALDLSPSMNTADVTPSRLVRARFKIADLLKLRKDGQTALLVYAAHAYPVTPLTNDVHTIAAHLPVLGTELMPVPGSNIAAAIDAAKALAEQSGALRGHVLLVTDGVGTQPLPPILAALAETGLRLSVLAVGTTAGAPIPAPGGGFVKDANGAIVLSVVEERALRELAGAAGGIYQSLATSDVDILALQALFETGGGGVKAQATTVEMDQWREAGPLLLLLVLPLAALVFRRGCLAVIVLALVPPPGQAVEWGQLWQRDDQQARQVLESGDPAQAAELFSDPDWKAAAYYRAGVYEPALAALADSTTADGFYNKGNALARLGRYPEAIAQYDEAIAAAPDHEDALHNRKLLQELLSEQQPPPSPDSSQDQESQSDSSDAEAGEQPESEQSANDAPAQPQDGQPSADEPSGPEQQASDEQAPPPQQAEHGEQAETAEQQGELPQSVAQADEQDAQDAEQEQATEQWLRRIPDDPGGLLRRKFLYQYQRSERSEYTGEPW